MIDIEMWELLAELTDYLDFWLNEWAADEAVLADWPEDLLPLEEESAEFAKSAELLSVFSAASWDESETSAVENIEDDEVDEAEEKLPPMSWAEIRTEDVAPMLVVDSGGDVGEEPWEIGGVINDAHDAVDVAVKSPVLAAEDTALADELLTEFGVDYVAADVTADERNVEADSGLLAVGAVGVIADDEMAGRIEDEPDVAVWGENGFEMWPPIEPQELAPGGFEGRTVEYGAFEGQTGVREVWREGESEVEMRDLTDLAARLAGPVADLVADRLNDELQIILRSR